MIFKVITLILVLSGYVYGMEINIKHPTFKINLMVPDSTEVTINRQVKTGVILNIWVEEEINGNNRKCLKEIQKSK